MIMKSSYTFNQDNVPFITVSIAIHILIFWAFGGIILYTYILSPPQHISPQHIVGLFIAVYFILEPITWKYIYYRLKLFQYNKHTSFSIDTERKVFTYMHGSKVLSFNSDDIEKWWGFEGGPYMSTFVELIEIHLKNGESVVISTGLENAVDFIYYHKDELELPDEYLKDGKYERSKSFHAYMEEIANVT